MTTIPDLQAYANRLNRECNCMSLDPEILRQSLRSTLDDVDLYQLITETRPHLFSPTMVFANNQHVARMTTVIDAIQRVTQLTAYQQQVMSWAPTIAQMTPGNSGVFYGYDFHLDETGPRLIEINSNAGGALLNVMLARAQRSCCPEIKSLANGPINNSELEDNIFSMFENEWRQAGRNTPLRSIAIVDDQPETQYLYPEFVLFQRLFEKRGLNAIIVDPSSLIYRDGKLWHASNPIDMVYNRLTDFDLSESAHQPLRQAYEEHNIVVTPHPHGHALFADKRNLILLSNDEQLQALEIDTATRELLISNIAHTTQVTPRQAEYFWNQRKYYFFKPATGYGSKAVYRGDKLTRGVWNDILQGNYVAQRFVKPTERSVRVGDTTTNLKFDVRCYVYEGKVQLLAARLYQGQATNFRTAGGGFAPVYY